VLDLRRLRVLKAVVETGSVTAAAARLSYTPSAVSQQVAALEREAGTPLLERIGRGVRPTAAGSLLAERASELLERLADAEAALAALRQGRIGTLRVLAFQTAGAGLVPSVVREFRATHPDVVLDVGSAEPDMSVAAVRDGTADVAIAVDPQPVEPMEDGLVRVPLLADEYRVLLRRDSPLAARRRVELADLADAPWITTSSCPGICEAAALRACAAAGFSPRFTHVADDYYAAQGYVEEGLGVALVPMLALGGVRPALVARPVRGEPPVRYVYAAARAGTTDEGPVRAFLAAARAVSAR
jgi:DNA-binding transcriptional LysR family regulator